MSIRSNHNHQSTYEPGIPSNTSICGQFLQAPSATNTTAWAGTWTRWNERYRKEYGIEGSRREVETQSGTIRCGSLSFVLIPARHQQSTMQDPPDWQEILKYFRGSELQNYFTKVLEDNLKALIKPQYVDHIPKAIKGNMTVSQMLDAKLELDNKVKICEDLELTHVLDRDVANLSGGELQRFAIAMSCIQRADV